MRNGWSVKRQGNPDVYKRQGLLSGIAHTNYGLRGAVNVFVNTAAVYGKIDKAGIVKVMRDMNIGA